MLILDSRDRRMQSPYQGWLLDEILVNAHGNLNVVSDRHMVRSPSSGYHMNLFMMKTLDGMKVIMCGSNDVLRIRALRPLGLGDG